MKKKLVFKRTIVDGHLCNTKKSIFKALIILSVVIVVFLASNATATTVREMTVEDVIRHSSLVFEGKVIAATSKRTGLKGRIHTLVTFQITEIISGYFNDKTLVLSYMGGVVDGVMLQVGDMDIPKVGDEGVFFVESLARPQVHPLTGWSQGHFAIKKDLNGKRMVTTSKGQLVKNLIKGRKTSKFEISKGVAIGVEVDNNLNNAMTIDEFKIKLKQIEAEMK